MFKYLLIALLSLFTSCASKQYSTVQSYEAPVYNHKKKVPVKLVRKVRKDRAKNSSVGFISVAPSNSTWLKVTPQLRECLESKPKKIKVEYSLSKDLIISKVRATSKQKLTIKERLCLENIVKKIKLNSSEIKSSEFIHHFSFE